MRSLGKAEDTAKQKLNRFTTLLWGIKEIYCHIYREIRKLAWPGLVQHLTDALMQCWADTDPSQPYKLIVWHNVLVTWAEWHRPTSSLGFSWFWYLYITWCYICRHWTTVFFLLFDCLPVVYMTLDFHISSYVNWAINGIIFVFFYF